MFLAANATTPAEAISGWGIPMATDPAFAVAILAVVGRHLPAPLRTFLLTLMRTHTVGGERLSPSHRAEELMRPFSAAVAVPVFALLAAGVSWSGADGFWASTITWGVLAGMLAGKFLGVFGASWLTARFSRAHLSPQLAWADIAGIGVLAGIGFTVSLLFAELSYTREDHLTDAKGAILLASATAALLAAVVLGCRSRHYRRRRQPLAGTPISVSRRRTRRSISSRIGRTFSTDSPLGSSSTQSS